MKTLIIIPTIRDALLDRLVPCLYVGHSRPLTATLHCPPDFTGLVSCALETSNKFFLHCITLAILENKIAKFALRMPPVLFALSHLCPANAQCLPRRQESWWPIPETKANLLGARQHRDQEKGGKENKGGVAWFGVSTTQYVVHILHFTTR